MVGDCSISRCLSGTSIVSSFVVDLHLRGACILLHFVSRNKYNLLPVENLASMIISD